jgi:hypothetical protein
MSISENGNFKALGLVGNLGRGYGNVMNLQKMRFYILCITENGKPRQQNQKEQAEYIFK